MVPALTADSGARESDFDEVIEASDSQGGQAKRAHNLLDE